MAGTNVVFLPKTLKKTCTLAYTRDSDYTLRETQVKQFGIISLKERQSAINNLGSPVKKTISLRGVSNKVKSKKYSTGYHESAVTTDLFNYLQQHVGKVNGKYKFLPAPVGSFFEQYNGKDLSIDTLRIMFKHADGFRTDTAQTILSSCNGEVAGHSGSDINTTGQPDAHNLLRKKVMEILMFPNQNGFTEKSIVVFLGAMTVASMAPGELARTVTGHTASLKAQPMKKEWENRRNEAKARVEALYDVLNPNEKQIVNHFAVGFLDSTENPGCKTRRINANRSTSPTRDAALNPKYLNGVAGGGYLNLQNKKLVPSKPIPKNIEDWPYYTTEVFRADRR